MEMLNKEELINDLIFYNDELEKLWEFHPENLDKRDIRLEYNKLKLEIKEITEKLDEIGEE
jgi:hypothetical protein